MLRRTVLRHMWRDVATSLRIKATVVCLRGKGPVGEQIAADGVRVITLDWRGGLPSGRLLMRLTRLLRELRSDIVHTCLYEAHRHGIPAARLAGCKVILMEEHGLNDWWMGRRERLLSIAMAYAATRVLAVSHAQAEHLIHSMHYPGRRLHVVPNCIDPERLGGHPGFSSGQTNGGMLASIGGLRWMKDYPLLLQVFQRVLQRLPECRLYIIGEGPLRGELESLARNLGIDGHVCFMGERRNILEILAGTDVYVHAGHLETFCIAMAEAMYAGCACVGPRTAALEELMDRGRVVALVPPEDPDAMANTIVGLLDDEDARCRMGKLAAEHVNSHYLPQHHVSGMMALYAKLLDDSGKEKV